MSVESGGWLPDGVEIHHHPERQVTLPETWTLKLPNGEWLPLIGNKNAKQRREMVEAVLQHRGLL